MHSIPRFVTGCRADVPARASGVLAPGSGAARMLPPRPAHRVRSVRQAVQAVLDRAAHAETVTLPTTALRSWRAQLRVVEDHLNPTAPLAAPMQQDRSWLPLLGALIAA